ncbi:SGNH/GDSL hydrolase family protein [Bradyrhizobium sp. A11]|uniref:SGNH/GDSL hydrolase family protein n=1 Tax=Bradyrhizobium sp. A11 TaxID=3133974 RepID=UPI003244E2ED
MNAMKIAIALKRAALLAALLVLSSSAGAANMLAPSMETLRIILIGDSTVAPHTGWGSLFCAVHVKEDVACLNLARGGRSTRTYREDGFWDIVKSEVQIAAYQKTFVLIQMGHNDKSLDPMVGTDLKIEFPNNLRRFVQELRAFGALPVLVTPLATRHFKDGQINNTLLPWAAEVAKVGRELNTPIVELNQSSALLFQNLGAVGSTVFSAVVPSEPEKKAAEAGTTLQPRLPRSTPVTLETPQNDPRRKYTQDYTHLNRRGAETVSALVASSLADAVPELRSHLIP